MEILRPHPTGNARRFLLRGAGGPMFFSAASEEALVTAVARLAGLSWECVRALATLAWRGGEVRLGAYTLRGWLEGDTVECPHCRAMTPVRLISHADELAAFSAVMPPDWTHHAGEFVGRGEAFRHPQQACAVCGENLGVRVLEARAAS